MVSIIVAFNRGKDYLTDCFASIREQDYKDIETVLIMDTCKEEEQANEKEDIQDLIAEYEEEINLKVYELKNAAGVSSARNLGVEKAAGEYIYFLDSDDYIIEDTIGGLIRVMDSEMDLAYGKIMHTWFKKAAFNVEQGDNEDDGSEKEVDSTVNNDDNFKFSEINDYRLKKYDALDKITVLGVLYKKSFLKDNNIQFNEKQIYYADAAFWIQILNCVKSYGSCEDSIYVKRYHNDKINLPAISQMEDERRDVFFVEGFLETLEKIFGLCYNR